jgi:hypothetical protein
MVVPPTSQLDLMPVSPPKATCLACLVERQDDFYLQPAASWCPGSTADVLVAIHHWSM